MNYFPNINNIPPHVRAAQEAARRRDARASEARAERQKRDRERLEAEEKRQAEEQAKRDAAIKAEREAAAREQAEADKAAACSEWIADGGHPDPFPAYWGRRSVEIVEARRAERLKRIATPRNYGPSTWTEGIAPSQTFGPVER